jgi:hypothetical protein
MTRHVVMTSGGTGSWATARRVADQHGTDNMVLLFADVLAEHPDLYRFLAEAASDIGIPVTRVCDGRTPEQVDVDRRWLSNSSIAQCSYWLKIVPCRNWLEANCDPAETILYVGIDWSESHRIPGNLKGWKPWRVEYPMNEKPYTWKGQIDDDLRARGIQPPLLNRQGFPHNNCGGACIRGGHAQWKRLYHINPDLFAAKERHEQRMRELLGADVTILKDRTGGATKPLPLVELRRRIEWQTGLDEDDWGGCGCTTDFSTAPAVVTAPIVGLDSAGGAA